MPRRFLSLLAVACALTACSGPRAPDTGDGKAPVARPATEARPASPAQDDATDTGDATRLTLYSGDYDALSTVDQPGPGMPGYALVERTLHYKLASGTNSISAANVPPAMDIEAALLRPQSAAVEVTAQRFVAAPTSTQDVLSRAVGRRVAVEHTSGGAKQTDNGILLSVSDGLSLALNDGRIKVIRDYDNFSILEAGDTLPRQAALQWSVDARQAGDAVFSLGYPMGGMAWRAEYLARLDAGKDCRLVLEGAAQVANRSGVTFSTAKLTLVAGEPNRVASPGPGYGRYAIAADAAAMAAPAPPPEERVSGEYHAYELPGTHRIGDGAIERLPLFASREAIACERRYVAKAGEASWIPNVPLVNPGNRGATGRLPVTATVSFRNTADAGPGRALPAGRVRVFDPTGFLGESRLGHVAEGEEVRLDVGTAFDLVAEREATSFSLDRAGHAVTESFAVTLRNAKADDVEVTVSEPLPRWSEWEILASSVPVARKEAQQVEFAVTVPAKGEARLTYTVRYRWPKGINP